MAGLHSNWCDRQEYVNCLHSISFRNRTFYHDPIWLDIVERGFGVKSRYIVTKDTNDRIIGLTPCNEIRKGPFRLLGSPLRGLHTEFAGPLFTASLQEKDIEAVWRSQSQLLREIGSYIEFMLPEKIQDDKSDLWKTSIMLDGYKRSFKKTLIIDVSQKKEDLWRAITGRARNMVRKSEKKGVIVQEKIPNRRDIIHYYSMLEATFTRQGMRVPHPKAFFLELKELASKGYARFLLATFEGRIVSGAIFLVIDGRMLFLSGTSTEEGMRLAASSLIQWHAMKLATEIDVFEYDMGGLGVTGIDKFKQSFGGAIFSRERWIFRTAAYEFLEPLAMWAYKKNIVSLGGAS